MEALARHNSRSYSSDDGWTHTVPLSVKMDTPISHMNLDVQLPRLMSGVEELIQSAQTLVSLPRRQCSQGYTMTCLDSLLFHNCKRLIWSWSFSSNMEHHSTGRLKSMRPWATCLFPAGLVTVDTLLGLQICQNWDHPFFCVCELMKNVVYG